MSSKKWSSEKLGNIVEINAKSITGNFSFNEIEYIDTSSVTNNRFEPLQKLKLSEAPSRAKRIVRDGDVIISTVRPIQRHFGFIRNPQRNVIASTGFAVLTPKKIHPEFLYYYLSQDSITYYLNGIAETTTTTFPAFRPDTLEDLQIEIPDDIQVQRRIANILSVLDEKIELNRQTNATLEAIAQAIFKEWFVDFNFPGATADMLESKLGMIPKGWTVGKIKDFSKRIQYGLTQSASTLEIGPHFLRITDIQNGQINWADVPYCEVDEKDVKKYKIDNYDIFIARTGASTGENVLAINPPNAVFASYLIRIQFTKPQLAVNVGKLLRSKQYFEFIDSIKSGSAQPNANAQQLTDFDIVLPTLDILDNYFRIVVEIENKKAEYQVQSTTLATLRDAVLPKLMNGEIEV